MPTLSVSVNHIATVRQARDAREPDPVQAAVLIELAGAHGITAHLREDRRHIQDRDVYLLKQIISTRLDLSIAPTAEMVGIAVDVLPHTVTLVPERRDDRGADEGLTVRGRENELAKILSSLQDNNIRTSLFIDADVQQVKAAKRIGATSVEFNTRHYATASGESVLEELERLRDAAYSAHNLDLLVAAGRGLDYRNIRDIAELRRSDADLIDEIVVGHAIVARGCLSGLENAVRDMLALL